MLNRVFSLSTPRQTLLKQFRQCRDPNTLIEIARLLHKQYPKLPPDVWMKLTWSVQVGSLQASAAIKQPKEFLSLGSFKADSLEAWTKLQKEYLRANLLLYEFHSCSKKFKRPTPPLIDLAKVSLSPPTLEERRRILTYELGKEATRRYHTVFGLCLLADDFTRAYFKVGSSSSSSRLYNPDAKKQAYPTWVYILFNQLEKDPDWPSKVMMMPRLRRLLLLEQSWKVESSIMLGEERDYLQKALNAFVKLAEAPGNQVEKYPFLSYRLLARLSRSITPIVAGPGERSTASSYIRNKLKQKRMDLVTRLSELLQARKIGNTEEAQLLCQIAQLRFTPKSLELQNTPQPTSQVGWNMKLYLYLKMGMRVEHQELQQVLLDRLTHGFDNYTASMLLRYYPGIWLKNLLRKQEELTNPDLKLITSGLTHEHQQKSWDYAELLQLLKERKLKPDMPFWTTLSRLQLEQENVDTKEGDLKELWRLISENSDYLDVRFISKFYEVIKSDEELTKLFIQELSNNYQ